MVPVTGSAYSPRLALSPSRQHPRRLSVSARLIEVWLWGTEGVARMAAWAGLPRRLGLLA